MSNTQVLNNDAAGRNVTKAQETRIVTEMIRGDLYDGLMGKGSMSAFRVVNDLTKQRGDTIRLYFGGKLLDDGVDGDDTLEGNEEAIRDFYQEIRIGQKRKAVRLAGKLTEQRSQVPLRVRSGELLSGFTKDIMNEYKTWSLYGARGVRAGNGLITPITFTGFAGNTLLAPDNTHWYIADTATSSTPAATALTATATMKTSVLEAVRKKIALLSITGQGFEPMTYDGTTVRGVVYLTPEQMSDLRQDSGWKDDFRLGYDPGKSNPIFKGNSFLYADFLIKENPLGVLFNNYGASGTLAAARAVVVAPNALGIAWGYNFGDGAGGVWGNWAYKEKEFDYANQAGFATCAQFGVQKLRWNGMDNGVFTFDTAYSA